MPRAGEGSLRRWPCGRDLSDISLWGAGSPRAEHTARAQASEGAALGVLEQWQPCLEQELAGREMRTEAAGPGHA